MSKRQTIEAKVMEYFEMAPLDQAKLINGLVNAKVKRRIQESGTVTVKQPVVRRKRAKRVNATPQAGATSATPF